MATIAVKHRYLFIAALVSILCIRPTFAYMGARQIAPADTAVNCGCPVANYGNLTYRFFNSFNYLMPFGGLTEATGWRYADGLKTYNDLFIKNDRIGRGRGGSSGYLELISPREAIRLRHPNNTFAINFTPCRGPDRYYILPVNFMVSHRIKELDPSFESASFSKTAYAYVKLLINITDKRPDQIIRNTFKAWARYSDGDSLINNVVRNINREYKTRIPLFDKSNYTDSARYWMVIDTLVAKKLRQLDVITTAFVLESPGVHALTKLESQRLYDLYYRNNYYITSTEDFYQEYIAFKLGIDIEAPKINIEIDTTILNLAVKPATSAAYVPLVVDVSPSTLKYRKALEMGINSICMPPVNIAGTGIGVGFDKGTLVSDRSQNQAFVDKARFPQLTIRAGTGKPIPADTTYNDLLTNFTGLKVDTAQLRLKDGDEQITVNATLLINNKLIAGTLLPKPASANSKTILVTGSNGKPQKMKLTKLVEQLKRAGLTDVTLIDSNGSPMICFKKIVPTT